MDVFVGQLLLVPYTYAPKGWAFCQGQILPINQNAALFSLLGTLYGGNGTTNFALPNLQGAMPVSQGQLGGGGNYVMGQTGGVGSVTLTAPQLAAHTHQQQASGTVATSNSPSGNTFAPTGGRGHATPYYIAPSNSTQATINATALQSTGGNEGHLNYMPFLALNWIIALLGIYPSRP